MSLYYQDTFEDAFAGRGLQIPWYIIAGNDDYKGNISAELSYSKISKCVDYYYVTFITCFMHELLLNFL